MGTTSLVMLAILVVVALFAVSVYNRLVRLRNGIGNAFAQIDVQLKRRHDLIPNLVETVKAYAAHETEAFEAVSTARAHALGAQTLDDRAAADGETRSALGRLFAIAEAYPELRAVEAYTRLQTELADTEDKIAAARRYYNAVVQRFNTKQQTIPTSLIASALGFSPREFYRLEDDAERDPVPVEVTR